MTIIVFPVLQSYRSPRCYRILGGCSNVCYVVVGPIRLNQIARCPSHIVILCYFVNLLFCYVLFRNKKRKNYSKICLDSKDLKTLDKNSLITIGAHTHTHTNLKILNKDEAINDICKCTKILENLLDHKVKHFAYPYGGLDQADIREYDIIKNLSFSSAVTDRVYPIKEANLFSLPRIGVGKNANEKEKEMSDKIKSLSPAVHVCKKLSIDSLISLIAQVDLVIGSDTGPTHMAWALNIPSITLCGPTPGYRNTYKTNTNKNENTNNQHISIV